MQLRFERTTLILVSLLFANVLVRLLVALRPLEYLDGLTITDDSYLALTIARNIARGLGSLYGSEYTNGFQPLFVFLMSPAFLVFPDDYYAPIRWAMLAHIIFDTATLFLLFRYTMKLSTTVLVPITVAVTWILSPYVIAMTLNVLETAIAVFFMVASLVFSHIIMHEERPAHRAYFLLGLLLGCAVVARIDQTFLAMSILAWLVWMRRRESKAVLTRVVLTVIGGMGIVVLPWLAYSYSYTGLLYQVSGEAVRFNSLSDVAHQPTLENLYIPMMRRAAGVIVRNNWIPLLIIGGVITWLLARRRRMRDLVAPLKPLVPALAFAVLLTAAYVGYIFTPWYLDRYLYPVGIVILLVLAVVLGQFWTDASSPRRTKSVLSGLILALVVLLNIQLKPFRELFTSIDTDSRGYMNLGLWARTFFPDGTVIGAQQSGALGYFADNLRVVNLDGVVNASCYRSLVERRNIDYIKDAGIRYVIGWPVDYKFVVNHSKSFRSDDLTLVRRIEGFRSANVEWCVWKVRLE